MIRSTLCICALLALSACQSQPAVRLMPPPTALVKSSQDTFARSQQATAAAANAQRSPDIALFYATNRTGKGPATNRHYTRDFSDSLHLGVADLRVGDGTLTWDALHALSTNADDAARPEITLQSLHEQAKVETLQTPAPTEIAGSAIETASRDTASNDTSDPATTATAAALAAWFTQIDTALAASADPNLTIYVHGANTGVERATAQAAQYQHFTGRSSVVLSYVWPSAENHWRFSRDVANTQRSAPTFAYLLRMLSQRTRAARINIIAYSSGSMVAAGALATLDTPDPRFAADTPRMGEVYFAAPDADFRTFVAQLQRYKGIGPRVTVSANLGDRVLLFSRIHQGASRAGRPRMGELGDDATRWLLDAAAGDALDLLQVKPAELPGLSLTAHAFWYDHPWVSSDLLLKMLYGLAPAQRGLQPGVSGSGVQYWDFPADYPQRLMQVLDALPPPAPR